MKVNVRKWGNSLAVRIPKPLAIESSIKQGSVVDLALKNGRIVVKPLSDAEETLEELVAEITPENMHPEINFILTEKETYPELLKKTQGAWWGFSWEKTRVRRTKVELAASQRRKKTW